MDKKTDALNILEEGLCELESKKGSISTAVQKLARASSMLGEDAIYAWTQMQLGNVQYTAILEKLFNFLNEDPKEDEAIEARNKKRESILESAKKLNISFSDSNNINELYTHKSTEASGGLNSIVLIEQIAERLSKLKKGNDGTHYVYNINSHLSYINKHCYSYISSLIDKLKYSGTVKSSFDLLKDAVDDKFLEINPELAEQLMLAFKSISSDNKEEWSQALTTCRRLLESLADNLYPANDKIINNRTFKQNQYVNRLWQFMHEAIQSDTNKTLAKAHVDYLGSWLERNNKATNKGVHDEVTQLEATKFVFHIYLMLADLLEYLDDSVVSNTKPHIKKITIDELEALLNINRNIAKNIIKARVKNGGLTLKQLGEVSGIGNKTLEKAKELIEF
ncbi:MULTISPECIES: helix-hairpin-helix domain-containing protein [Psychrobacter]|uniref:helix-hairpin-helix domain-containing protein n=3 Tax=Moraxellaceae TaxID=468 RepID=UPI00237B9B3C|nr:helix-hairpin-helix domain-containing protein [Psychrobacter sp. A3]MDE0490343.1 helix-hairpin-helix domain-containing protein [Psychrobacter sp. A3]